MKDYFGYQGKVCVVTGAASGMGKATAEMLVDLGAKVYALDWADVQVDGIEQYIHTDLSQKESIDQAFEHIPAHIDSFFGVAGVSGAKTDFVTTTKIDLISNKYICEEILGNRMSTGGSISFITSTGGAPWALEGNKKVYMPVLQAKGWDGAVDVLNQSVLAHLPGTLGYPFSKLAMNYYTIMLQSTFASKGIRVNAVLPGSTDTGMKAVEAALAMFNEDYVTFPRDDIARLSGMTMPVNKRNWRKQIDHVQVMNTMKALKKQLGESISEGRPKGSGTAQGRVYQWRQQHPMGRKVDCHRDTGLDPKTVRKWWDCPPTVGSMRDG